MNKLNNKGYMLVEIILAFALTFGLAYFILDLTINLKNKNDDLMVETLITTDQAIITNKLMKYAIDEGENFNCDNLKIDTSSKTISYNDKVIDVVNEYTTFSEECATDVTKCCTHDFDAGKINIKIPLDVKQMGDENFNVIVDYKYKIEDMRAPSCNFIVDGTTITVTYSDDSDGSGIDFEEVKTKNGDWTFNNNGIITRIINKVGTYEFKVYDMMGNNGSCKLDVVSTTSYDYACGSYECGSYECGSYECGTTCCSSIQDSTIGCSIWCPTYCTSYCTNYCTSYCTGYDCRNNPGYTKSNNSYCYKVIK